MTRGARALPPPAPHHDALCHKAPHHDAMHHDTMHHDALHHDAMHHDAVHHDAVQHGVAHHGVAHHDAMRYCQPVNNSVDNSLGMRSPSTPYQYQGSGLVRLYALMFETLVKQSQQSISGGGGARHVQPPPLRPFATVFVHM